LIDHGNLTIRNLTKHRQTQRKDGRCQNWRKGYSKKKS